MAAALENLTAHVTTEGSQGTPTAARLGEEPSKLDQQAEAATKSDHKSGAPNPLTLKRE